MKNTLIIFFLLWGAAAFTQTEKIKVKKEVEKKKSKKDEKKETKEKKSSAPIYSFGSIDLAYGQKIFAKSFYSQLNTFDSLDFNLPTKFIAIGFSGYKFNINPRGNYTLKMYWNFILPQTIKIQDSVSSNLNGFWYNFGCGKSLSTKKKMLSVGFYVGFSTGFTKAISSELGKQINPFFSPSISIQPKLVVKRFSISFLIDADYDVTNPEWKSFQSKDKSRSIKGFNQTGVSFIGTLGWALYKY